MDTDLDPLMTARRIGTLIIPMHEAMHASFRWMTRGAKVTRGYAVKPAGRDPFLVAYPMEREEAAATGVAVRDVHEFDYDGIFRRGRNSAQAYGMFFDRVLRDTGCAGPILFSGHAPIHLYGGVFEFMRAAGWDLHQSGGEDPVQIARKRKDQWEVEAIRSVGERTELVVAAVRDLLRRPPADLRIGHLKDLVSREIVRLGMVEDHETILSHGRDAGIPHSRGDATQRIEPSVPIVLDIFPADRTTGYFFDLTRTFCIGPVPEELRAIHADVLAAYDLAVARMRPGTTAASHQAAVCDFFESKGYATTRTDPAARQGYVHSLGHGVGLDIHERPSFSLNETNHDQVETGDVLTIEPGLYFPDRGIGVRIEDTFVITADGAESLSRGDRALQP